MGVHPEPYVQTEPVTALDPYSVQDAPVSTRASGRVVDSNKMFDFEPIRALKADGILVTSISITLGEEDKYVVNMSWTEC